MSTIDESGMFQGEVKFLDAVEAEALRWMGSTEATILTAIAANAINGEGVVWPGDMSRWRYIIVDVATKFKNLPTLEFRGL